MELDKEEFVTGIQCKICKEDFLEGEVISRIPSCCHVAHLDCFWGWFDYNKNKNVQRCPVCNAVLSTREMIRCMKINEFNEAQPQEGDLRRDDSDDIEVLETITPDPKKNKRPCSKSCRVNTVDILETRESGDKKFGRNYMRDSMESNVIYLGTERS